MLLIIVAYKPQVDPHLCKVTFVPVEVTRDQLLRDRATRKPTTRRIITNNVGPNG